MTDSHNLLRDYVQNGSEAAFHALVTRYLDLVYAVAFRRVEGDAHRAEDVAQTVFVDLARLAGTLGHEVMLGGWLHRHTCFVAAKTMRSERRRQSRERQAVEMNALQEQSQANLSQVAPLLDEAINELGDADRKAILLRFFEQNDFRKIGEAIGSNEDAARMRVKRALEKLQSLLKRRGVTTTAAALSVVLAANAVQVAPIGLSAVVTTAAALACTRIGATATATKAIALANWQTTLMIAALAGVVGMGLYWEHRTKESRRVEPAAQQRAEAESELASVDPSGPTVRRESIAANGQSVPGINDSNAASALLREPFTTSTQFSLDAPPGAVAVQPDGRILAAATLGGWFIDEQAGTLGWYTRGAMRFEPDGALDRSFYCDVGRPDANIAWRAHLDLKSDGRIFMSGNFDTVDGKRRPSYAVLLPDGRLDDSFVPWRRRTNVPGRTYMEGGTYPAALLSDGSVAVMSGAVEGPRAPYPWTVYRLDPSGQWIQPKLTNSPPIDWGYPPGLIMTLRWAGFWGRRPVDWTREASLTPQRWMPPGNQRPPIESDPFWQWVEPPTARQAAIVFKSLFEEVPMELCRYAVRLPDGGTILAISEGTPQRARSRLMRFDRDWRPDLSFTNQFEADFRSWLTLKRLRNGKFLFAGVIGTIGGEEFPGIVRLESNGVIDHTFHCETSRDLSGRVFDFAVQKDQRIIICGDFTQVNGTPAPHIARLNPDGSLDSTFKPPFLPREEVDRRRFVRITQLSRKNRTTLPNSATKDLETRVSGATNAIASAEMVLIVSMAREGTAAVVQFTGLPGQSYILQANESMSRAEWSNVSTNQTSGTGAGSLRDAEAEKFPMRFYRIARP